MKQDKILCFLQETSFIALTAVAIKPYIIQMYKSKPLKRTGELVLKVSFLHYKIVMLFLWDWQK